ncbi:MAG TPA: stalk domain-containing protein [Syntrophomonadaceae bacterium]|nr:stalk domain-containing protein [Syntrophomonadaceae bacterium]HPR93428.1 stalk domain-containing protein [Syntrophomonadaceae bacterium]
MKKVKTKLSIIMVLVFVFTMVIGATAFGAWSSVQKVEAYSGVKVFLNGTEVINPDQPLIINDRTYVPLRMIMELVGSNVTWDAANYKVMLTGASAGQLAAKDAKIADLEKQNTQLKNEIAALEKDTGADLDKIEADLLDTFEDAGKKYFDDDYIDVSLSLSGDEDGVAYSIKLKFGSKSSYDDLSDADESDIEDFLDAVEDELVDAFDGTDYEDADITGKLTDEDNSKLYAKYNGSSYTYSWGTDDLSDIEDDVNDAFSSVYDYFGDYSIKVDISLTGDEDDIKYEIEINASRSSKYDEENELAIAYINDLEDDVIDEIKDEIDGTDFEHANISGDYSVEY